MDKRYAVLTLDRLIFNETENWFNKSISKWVEQKADENATIRAFERKYSVRLVWQREKGYVLA